MPKEIYRIEIPIVTEDEYSKGVDKAKKDVEKLEKTVEKTGKELNKFDKDVQKTSKETEELGKSAEKTEKKVDKLGTSSKGASKGVDQVGTSSGKSEKQVSRFQKVVDKNRRSMQRMTGKRWRVSLRAVDRASGVIRTVGRTASRFVDRTYRTTLRAVNFASGVIGRVRRALFSLPTMITIGLGVVGLGKLSESTLGAAMNFEGYNVSMEHWLDGDQKQAKDLVNWMGRFADSTPFSSADLFPALSRGIGVADGSVKDAKRLLTIASNMSALTPNRSVEDAMEALASAQMGEFQLLKAYNMKITADDYDEMGWTGFLDLMDRRFENGAKKFSQTASGQLATLRGYTSTIFREAGVGILESMKPRLNEITAWLDNNQETWGEWKNTVQQAGLDASEWLFSKLENGFMHIKNNYLENDAFKKLDFEGKVKFIMDDLGKWWDETGLPLLQDVGMSFGKAMYDGMVWGVKEGVKGIGGMWGKAVDEPSAGNFASAGITTAIAASIGSLILSPLLRGVRGIGKTAGGVWKVGKKAAGLFGIGKGKTPVAPTTVPTGKVPNTTNLPKNRPVIYDQYGRPLPPTGGSPKPTPVPRTPKTPKIPGLSGIMNFGRRIPVLGTLLGGLALATAPKEEKTGVAGGIAGGIAGAATGAAVGSVVPVIGTTIGGIIGGVLGSMGGSAIGNWFNDNWSNIKKSASNAGEWIADKWDSTWSTVKNFGSDAGEWISNAWSRTGKWFDDKVWSPIKKGATSAGTWISDKFDEGAGFVADKWSDFSGWFDDKVWTPVSDAAINTMNFVVGLWSVGREWLSEKWSDFSDWFGENVWEPVKEGASIAGQWISDRWSDAKDWVSETWTSVSDWFDETVWTPIKEGATATGQWISDKYTEAKDWTKETWSNVSSWFGENVWEPIKIGASLAGLWISERYDEAKAWTKEAWSTFSGWFSETVWAPIKEGATAAGAWISERFDEAKAWVSEAWGVYSSWFDETVWTPVKEGAKATTDWIGEKFDEGVQWAKDAWSGLSEWFDENVWSPVKTGAQEAWGWVKGKWNDAKSWASDITKRGEEITGITTSGGTLKSSASLQGSTSAVRGQSRLKKVPGYAQGTNYHPGGPAIVGDGGGSELVQFPNGSTWFSPTTDTIVNLPRGTQVLPHNKTKRLVDVPQYADGVGNVSTVGGTVVYGDTHNEVGDTHVTVMINGSDIDTDDPDAFAYQIADKVAGIVADKVEQVASNMPAV